MAKGSEMNEMIKTEERDDPYMGDQSRQPFVLLLWVTQSNGKSLPIGGFTGRAIMNDQEVVMELEDDTSMM